MRMRIGRITGGRSRQRGQSVVEFALVIPLFLAILTAIVEFAFSFNAVLATQYASRDAALVAAEAGNGEGSDCVILATVDSDMGAPTNPAQITSIEIYRTTAAGVQVGAATVWARTGTTDCTLPDGSTTTLGYTRTADGYPEASRCNVLAGCDGRGLDHIGVQVNYRYEWKTPLGHGFSDHLDVTRSNSMRMEPVL
jgi:Flp pilus assembly protein TadG